MLEVDRKPMVATSGKVVETRKVAKRKAWALLRSGEYAHFPQRRGHHSFVTTDTPTGNTTMILCADAHRGSQLIKKHNRCDETFFPVLTPPPQHHRLYGLRL